MEEVQIVNPKEYGIEEAKAGEIMGSLPQIIEERKPLTEQFNEVIRLDIEDPETGSKAKELRLLIQKNRTQGINVWHKTNKEYFLKGGNFVDAIKRKEVAVNERMESDLIKIEKHEELKEQARLAAIQEERVKILEPYVEDAAERDLSEMPADVWEAFLTSKKKEHEEKIEAEKKAQEEQARVAKENEALKAELKAKEEAEQEAKQEEEAKKQAELNKGDEEKVLDLIQDLQALKGAYSFSSDVNKKMYGDVGLLLDKIVNHIKK